MRLRTALPLTSLVLVLVSAALPARAAEPSPLEGLVEVGRGELTWFGLSVYDAHLYTASGRFEGLDAPPVALEIRYERDIEGRQLVETTRKEWRRLSGPLGLDDPARVEGWLAAVGRIWPDVGPGDRIISLLAADGTMRFYGNDGLLGVVEDPDFGPALLGIWLHPETRVADLRSELVGPAE